MTHSIDLHAAALAGSRLAHTLHMAAPEEMLPAVLAEFLDVSHSPIGVCGYVADDGTLRLGALSEGVLEPTGSTADRTLELPADTWGGLWGEVRAGRQARFRNGPHPVPQGHLPIERSLGVPILAGDDLIGTIHVANRDYDYDDADSQLLSLLCTLIAPTLRARLRREPESNPSPQRPLTPLRAHLRALEVEGRLSQLEELLDTSPAVVYVKDLAGRYEFINRRYEELFHVDRRNLLGVSDYDIFPRHLADEFRRNDREVAERGAAMHLEEVARHDDGPHSYFSVKFPLKDAHGRVRAVAGISTDVTETRRAKREVDSLARRLSLILDAVSDGVFGIDRNGNTTFINPTAVKVLGYTEQELLGKPILDCITTHPARKLRGPREECPALAAVHEGSSFADDQATFYTRQAIALPVEYVSNPIYEGDQVTGAVVTFRDQTADLERQRHDEARQKLEHHRLATDLQLESVRQLQLEMFSATQPHVDGFDIAGRNVPKEIVSGDFYDFIALPDGSLMVIVGDCSGHDLPSAVHMVEAHAALHALLDCQVPMSDLLPRLNHLLCRHLSGRFLTLFLARLHPASRTLEFAGAGHEAVLLHQDGRLELLPSSGLVLGLDNQAVAPAFASRTLESGDHLILMTDGLQETVNVQQQYLGRARLDSVLKGCSPLSAEETIARLFAESDLFAAGEPPADDRTAVVVRVL
jgi:PAS domain S-box-containing protein